MINWRINFDGACHNKAGENNPMGVGIAVFKNDVYAEEESNAIHALDFNDGKGTSNVAEWIGCVEAMRKACRIKRKFPDSKFTIYSDSQIIVYQFNQDYQIKKQEFIKYFNEAHKLAKISGIKNINWIPREENKEADQLSKQGLKKEI